MNDSPKPKRRWYRFSLRTLLLVVTVAILSFGGWVQYRRQRAQENREELAAVEKVAAAIEEFGGEVFTYEFDVGASYSYVENRRPQTWLEKQFGDPGDRWKVSVVFTGTGLTDAVLEQLKGMTKLESLQLDGTMVTDAGLEQLDGLKNLQRLYLTDTSVTDVGLEHLRGLTNLEELYLDDTSVTDEGVKKLQQALPNCWIEH